MLVPGYTEFTENNDWFVAGMVVGSVAPALLTGGATLAISAVALEVSHWAAVQLSSGRAETPLIELASMYGEDSDLVSELLARLREEHGLGPVSPRAALRVVALDVARRIVAGAVVPHEGARQIFDNAMRIQLDLDPEFIAFTGVVSEWDDDESHRNEIDGDILRTARDYISSYAPPESV